VSEVETAAPRLDLHGAFVRRIDLSGASLREADLSGADATNANFRSADFAGAILRGTVLRGADLTGAKNLTIDQLAEATIDDLTILPKYIDRGKILVIASNNQKPENGSG
jgi:uncharacterized protein YjbI with pentapeptide repeats